MCSCFGFNEISKLDVIPSNQIMAVETSIINPEVSVYDTKRINGPPKARHRQKGGKTLMEQEKKDRRTLRDTPHLDSSEFRKIKGARHLVDNVCVPVRPGTVDEQVNLLEEQVKSLFNKRRAQA